MNLRQNLPLWNEIPNHQPFQYLNVSNQELFPTNFSFDPSPMFQKMLFEANRFNILQMQGFHHNSEEVKEEDLEIRMKNEDVWSTKHNIKSEQISIMTEDGEKSSTKHEEEQQSNGSPPEEYGVKIEDKFASFTSGKHLFKIKHNFPKKEEYGMSFKTEHFPVAQKQELYANEELLRSKDEPLSLQASILRKSEKELSVPQFFSSPPRLDERSSREKHGRNLISFDSYPDEQTKFRKYFQETCEEYLKIELEKMIKELLATIGKPNSTKTDIQRSKYLQSPHLLEVYDKLVMKYFSAKRCREDIVRYVIRKAFKVIRDSLIQKQKMCAKTASAILCTKYFKVDAEQLIKAKVNLNDADAVVDFFMPYGKKSRNKTMNTDFIVELFKSGEFCQDYQSFLARFEEHLKEDNEKKISKLVTFVINCMKYNCLHKLTTYHRYPWIEVWNEEAKSLAGLLLTNQDLMRTYKRRKN